MKYVLAFLLLFVVSFPLHAATDGDVSSQGHVFKKGLWWLNGQSYVRTVETVGYWNYGCYKTYQQWRYYAYTPPAATATVNEDESQFDLELARLARIQAFHKNSIEKIAKLGLTGIATPYISYPGIGTVPYAAMANTPLTYGVTANTVYGYNQLPSYQGVAYQPSPPVDLNQLYLYLNQSLVRTSDLQGQGVQGLLSVTTLEGQQQYQLRRMALQRDMILEFIKATSDPTAIKASNITFSISPGGGVQPQPLPANQDAGFKAQVDKAWVATKPLCAACHTGEAALKNKVLLPQGFDVEKYPEYTPEQKEIVWDRIISKDEKRRMPRKQDGSPGDALPPANKQAFFLK